MLLSLIRRANCFWIVFFFLWNFISFPWGYSERTWTFCQSLASPFLRALCSFWFYLWKNDVLIQRGPSSQKVPFWRQDSRDITRPGPGDSRKRSHTGIGDSGERTTWHLLLSCLISLVLDLKSNSSLSWGCLFLSFFLMNNGIPQQQCLYGSATPGLPGRLLSTVSLVFLYFAYRDQNVSTICEAVVLRLGVGFILQRERHPFLNPQILLQALTPSPLFLTYPLKCLRLSLQPS